MQLRPTVVRVDKPPVFDKLQVDGHSMTEYYSIHKDKTTCIKGINLYVNCVGYCVR